MQTINLGCCNFSFIVFYQIFFFQMRVITFLFTYILFIISSLASPLQLGYGKNPHKETHFTQTYII